MNTIDSTINNINLNLQLIKNNLLNKESSNSGSDNKDNTDIIAKLDEILVSTNAQTLDNTSGNTDIIGKLDNIFTVLNTQNTNINDNHTEILEVLNNILLTLINQNKKSIVNSVIIKEVNLSNNIYKYSLPSNVKNISINNESRSIIKIENDDPSKGGLTEIATIEPFGNVSLSSINIKDDLIINVLDYIAFIDTVTRDNKYSYNSYIQLIIQTI